MKVYVHPNLDKVNCKAYVTTACEILNSHGVLLFADEALRDELGHIIGLQFGEPVELVKACDVILVAGGDGTILKCARKTAVFNKPLLGLNSGRLGFMATLEHTELELLNDFCDGKYTLDSRMMISAVVSLENGAVKKYVALNDIVLSKGDGCKIADFEVSKNATVVSALRADGLIFSTPTGATAYSLSAGGPIIEPVLDCIEFTQICPHSLFARSMIFSPDSELSVKYNAINNANVILTVDGECKMSLSQNDKVLITRSEQRIQLIDIKGSNFHDSINRKLMRPLKDTPEY